MMKIRSQGSRTASEGITGLGFRGIEFRVHRLANLSAARAGLEAFRFDRNLESVVAAIALTGLVLDPATAVCLVVLGDIILARASVDLPEFHREVLPLVNDWDMVFGEGLRTKHGREGRPQDLLKCLNHLFASKRTARPGTGRDHGSGHGAQRSSRPRPRVPKKRIAA